MFECVVNISEGLRSDVVAAIAPYMTRSKLLAVERRWREWVEIQKAREGAGQLSRRRREELEGHLTRGHLDTLRARPLQAVDYAALKKDPRWKGVVRSLERSKPDALPSAEAKLAFWINAYNVLAIQTVLSNYPLDSIRDVGSFFSPVWKRQAGKIDGKAVTLDQIEHQILRPMGDPRIHAAIVCASRSCPSLRRERLLLRRDAEGGWTAENALGAPLRRLLVGDDEGYVWQAAAVPPGGRVRLARMEQRSANGGPAATRGLLAAGLPLAMELLETDPHVYLSPGGYLAFLAGDPFTEPALERARSAEPRAVVMGTFDEGTFGEVAP